MKKYKGYYIDGVIFKSKKDIDSFIQTETIKIIRRFNDWLFDDRYSKEEKLEITRMIREKEEFLHKVYNMPWNEIEMIPFNENI